MPTTVHGTLTRHFLRRFLENDLIAPDADRTQLLAVVGATLCSTTLLVTLFMSFPYVIIGRTPSQLALAALNDRFFYISLSMVVTALVAVAQWDSLVVDVRDASILEPLPVQPTTVRRAKLAAVGILGAAAAAAVNLMPALIFPWLLVYHTSLPVVSMLALAGAHALVTCTAAAFAFALIIALRESLSALCGPRLLTIVSPIVQGALIVLLGSALLLIPPASTGVAARGFSGWYPLLPPMWFVGAHEAVAGHILRHAPRAERQRTRATAAEPIAAAAYDQRVPHFATLGRRAALASTVVLLVGVCASWRNARRFPAAAPPRRRGRRWRAGTDVARAIIVRSQTARAGFFFTLATVWRSSLHRLTLACAAAAAVAAAVVTLSGVEVGDAMAVPPGVFVIQPILFGALLVAFRHAIRVPAELRANWAFQLAWRDRNREFMAGVRRAALAGIALPAVLLVLPLYAYFLGVPLAFVHAVFGVAGAAVVLEALLVLYEKVPFTCTYLPNENMKAFGVLYALAFLIGASVFGGMERTALQNPWAAARLLALLTVVMIGLRLWSRYRFVHAPVDFDEAPATTQRLGLHT